MLFALKLLCYSAGGMVTIELSSVEGVQMITLRIGSQPEQVHFFYNFLSFFFSKLKKTLIFEE